MIYGLLAAELMYPGLNNLTPSKILICRLLAAGFRYPGLASKIQVYKLLAAGLTYPSLKYLDPRAKS